MADETFYHGTKHELMPGDIIHPGSDGLAWAAREPWYAARRAMHKFTGTQTGSETERPRIYTVEPLGETEDIHLPGMLVDPSRGEGKQIITRGGLLVTGEHTPDTDEWNKLLAVGENRAREKEGAPPLSAAQQSLLYTKNTAGKFKG